MKREGVDVKPLAVVDESGRLLDIASMNRKGFTKSTEQGELWILHEETGRVLPYGRGFSLVRVSDEVRWYQATVEPSGAEGRTVEGDRSAAEGRSSAEGPAGSKQGSPEEGDTSDAPDVGKVLGELCEVIRSRRRERPEGSYTTYLFDAGEEKIRKKTGEEAIELVLAHGRGEVVSEAADLVYHLLVLLNQLEIPLNEVIEELARRA